jgi:hypothetical protein
VSVGIDFDTTVVKQTGKFLGAYIKEPWRVSWHSAGNGLGSTVTLSAIGTEAESTFSKWKGQAVGATVLRVVAGSTGDDSGVYNLRKGYWSLHKHHIYEISSILERVAIYLRFLIQSTF